MKGKKSKIFLIILLLLLPPIIIFLVRNFLPSNYILSSLYKVIFIFPLFYRLFIYKKSLKDSVLEGFNLKSFNKNFWRVFVIGIILSGVYLFVYIVFRGHLDLEFIRESLNKLASVNTLNIFFIGAYIIFFNSFLEEFFWRGFLFRESRELMNPVLAYLITGIAFSFHHIIFYYNWFSLTFLLLVTLGLIGFSVIVSFIFEKYNDLYSCWLIHGMVDTIQIIIALNIFEII
jgi:uncharacterized protein